MVCATPPGSRIPDDPHVDHQCHDGELCGAVMGLCKMRQPLGWCQSLKLLTQLTELHATQSCTSASRKLLNDCGGDIDAELSVIPGAKT